MYTTYSVHFFQQNWWFSFVICCWCTHKKSALNSKDFFTFSIYPSLGKKDILSNLSELCYCRGIFFVCLMQSQPEILWEAGINSGVGEGAAAVFPDSSACACMFHVHCYLQLAYCTVHTYLCFIFYCIFWIQYFRPCITPMFFICFANFFVTDRYWCEVRKKSSSPPPPQIDLVLKKYMFFLKQQFRQLFSNYIYKICFLKHISFKWLIFTSNLVLFFCMPPILYVTKNSKKNQAELRNSPET